MKDFIIVNWQWLAAILISVVAAIIHLCQKRPVARSLYQQIDWIISSCLPGLIVAAEKTADTGEKKLDYVISRACDVLQQHIVCNEKELQIARQLFAYAIENILATPRKKVSYEKK